jgi:hypothetical protein
LTPGREAEPAARASVLREPHAARPRDSVAGESEGLDPPRPRLPEGEFGTELATELGGIFFLANVELHLDLYADFTAPRGPNLDLHLWDWLVLLARFLLPDPVDSLPDDPVWTLLAQLAGRGDLPAGADFKPPRSWHAPDEWRRVFGLEGCVWSIHHRRLRGWHPAGFWTIDVPAGVRPLGPRGMPRPRTGRLERWVDWWGAYVRARLHDALGLGTDTGDPHSLANVLFRHTARVQVSAARLDVLFSLDEMFQGEASALAVRLAGLDRDPGWIPAAARTVAFHFR